MKSQLNPLYWVDIAVYLAFGAFVVTQATWHAREIIGMCIAIAGFALWLTARFQLGESFSVSAQARKLVTTGLYSRFRNPIYYFAGVAFAGLFMVIGNLTIFLCFICSIPIKFRECEKRQKCWRKRSGRSTGATARKRGFESPGGE